MATSEDEHHVQSAHFACALYHTRSLDGGLTWSVPDSSGVPKDGPTVSNSIDVFEGALVGAKPVVFYGNWALHYIHWLRDGKWSPDGTIADAKGGLLGDDPKTSCISVACQHGSGQVVWIDGRHARTDLVGSLLAHPKDWPNNDVFALPMGQVMESGQNAARLKPLRLTENLSQATTVRAHAIDSRIHVVWAGRVKVGETRISAGKSPTIFYTTLPLE